MHRILISATLLVSLAGPALAGPPGLEPSRRPPGLEADRRPPPPHVIDEVRSREPQILEWLAANDPESHDRLVRLKERDPRAYVGQLVRVARIMSRAQDDPAVVQRHREMQELERAIRTLAGDWDALSAKEQKDARSRLEEMAGRLLDLKQEERRAHLEEIRAKAAELEQEIEERDRERKAVIESWLDDLLGEGPPGL